MTILWLDDVRNPFTLPFSKTIEALREDDLTGKRMSYDEFTDHIDEHGLPDLISFDHDLADEHYHSDMYKGDKYNKHYDSFKEKTGYSCAKWLVDYCIDNKKPLPLWSVHSQNPIGKKNIESLLSNFKNHE